MLSLVAVSTLLLGANALTPNNVMRRSDGTLSALKYTNVGGSGSYQQVTNMFGGTWPDCGVNPYCIQTEKTISGELTVAHFINIVSSCTTSDGHGWLVPYTFEPYAICGTTGVPVEPLAKLLLTCLQFCRQPRSFR